MPLKRKSKKSKQQTMTKQASKDPSSKDDERQGLLNVIASNPFHAPGEPKFWHGRVFTDEEEERMLLPPTMTWESPHKPRDDHQNIGAAGWLTASEYQDEDFVMKLKIENGAGISVSAGIGQAARGSHKKHPVFGGQTNKTCANPTPTHYALGALASGDLIHGWVQQNHDGLPQKAGFPQERINEIHGSWFDPSNPVVVYSGSLRGHEYNWMVKEAETSDLVLVLGTSLSGLNADQVPINAAYRTLNEESLGMVIINLQQTPQDGKASLRIFGSTDDVFQQLFEHLRMKLPKKSAPRLYKFPKDRKFLVPYDAQGELYLVSTSNDDDDNNKNNNNDSSHKMVWDLNVNARVQIVNHNVVGAGQPSHKPVLAQNPELIGKVIGWDDDSMSIRIAMSGKVFRLGYWWIETAIQGRAPTLPLVNPMPNYGTSGSVERPIRQNSM